MLAVEEDDTMVVQVVLAIGVLSHHPVIRSEEGEVAISIRASQMLLLPRLWHRMHQLLLHIFEACMDDQHTIIHSPVDSHVQLVTQRRSFLVQQILISISLYVLEKHQKHEYHQHNMQNLVECGEQEAL